MHRHSNHQQCPLPRRTSFSNAVVFCSILLLCTPNWQKKKAVGLRRGLRKLERIIRSENHSPAGSAHWFDIPLRKYAAGTLSFLRTSGLQTLVFSPDDDEVPLDLSQAFVQGLEWLMLAQAQECSWQVAVIGQLCQCHYFLCAHMAVR